MRSPLTLIVNTVAVMPLMCALQANAQVDLTTLDRDMAGPRAQVLVLATPPVSG
jgi:hypothetical protein